MTVDPHSLFDIKGKVAVITGASGAFGVLASEVLAAAGAKLVLTAGKSKELEEIGARCREVGAEVEPINKRPTSEAACQAIVKAFTDHDGDRPNLDLLQQTMRRVGEFYSARDAEAAEAAGEGGDGEGDEGELGGAGGTAGKPPRSSGLASRADAVRILQQVATFLRKAEPSSPAPMFIDRAVKLLQMDFTSIVKELMPDSRNHIEMLGGISLEDPDSDSD